MFKLLFSTIIAMIMFTGCFHHGHHYGYYQSHNTTDVIIVKEPVKPICHLQEDYYYKETRTSCSTNHCTLH